MGEKVVNSGASLFGKLKHRAKEAGVPFETFLRRYAQERLIHLISTSKHADGFCLKGGVLMAALNEGNPMRPTEDIDFGGMNPEGTISSILEMLRDVCALHDGSDGLTFDVDTLRVLKDRDDGAVPGGKVTMQARIHSAVIPMKIDIGFGNPITPSVKRMRIQTIMPDLIPPPTISVYPLETVVAEKFHAMSRHGIANTRFKDYFDIYIISDRFSLDGEALAAAIRNTFAQFGEPIPVEPDGLSDAFVENASAAWTQFRSRVYAAKQLEIRDVIERVRAFIVPAAQAANGGDCLGIWEPGRGWAEAHALQP